MRPPLRPRALAAPALLVGCAALAILPWTLRNAHEFGRFIPLTTSTGLTAGGIYNHESYADSKSHGGWRFTQVVPEYASLFVNPALNEADVDHILRKDVSRFAWQHPGYVAEASAWDVLRMFEIAGGSVVDVHGNPADPPHSGSARPLSERIGLALAGALALLGAFAIIRSWRRPAGDARGGRMPHGPLYLWLVPILILLTSAPVGGLPRYRLPIDPFLMILAAIGMVWASDRLSQHRGSRS